VREKIMKKRQPRSKRAAALAVISAAVSGLLSGFARGIADGWFRH
jgi:hypothetical protein